MRKKKHAEHVNHERWLVSYADFITLLFAFFVVMFAVSQVDTKKMGRFTESFSQAIGLMTTPSGAGLLPAEGTKIETPPVERTALKGDPIAALQGALLESAKTNPSLAKVKVVRRGNELVLRLDAAVLFESGDDRLDESAKKVLIAIAEQVKPHDLRLRVEGHTDDRPISGPRFRSNWDLSTRRATSVVMVLATDGGLAPTRLAATGYGEFQPIASNADEAGRAQNRRVDFVLTSPEPQVP
ncbi:MAG: flagellar motor protein MotB [Polyangiaceae bacterium]